MKDTKKRILQTALALFNSQGMAKITLRSIANEMGISQGNLNYHFKKRNDIIEALYFQIVESISNSIVTSNTAKTPLEAVFHISKTMLFTFYEYRFFLLDFVSIMRENSKIKAHYKQLMQQRALEFTELIDVLIENNLMRQNVFPNEYENLFKRFQILSDFWMSSVVIEKGHITEALVHQYSEIIHQTIFPYLTLKGQEMYKSLSLV
ncbi:TetR/AcrR family transcriptional regulator [Flavobacteriaceae bacterium MHTCC 0001]